MTPYPRILHVGFNPIGSSSNTGLTLASMFGAWPGDRLFEVYTPSRQPAVRHENVVVAPLSVAPADGLVRTVLGRRLPPPIGDGLNNSVSRKGQRLGAKTRARIVATTLNDLGPVRVTGRWLEEVEAFAPQAIHSLLGSVRITKIVTRLAERLDIPVVPHFMDDWPSTLFADGRLGGVPRRETARVLEGVLERSPLCLVIGDDMAEEFGRRYRRPCVVVGNSVDFDAFRDLGVDQAEWHAEPMTLRYVGGLHLGRADAIARVAAALESTQQARWKLVVHAPAADAARLGSLEAAYHNVEAGPTLTPDQVPSALVHSDALLFIESSDPAIHAFTRWSVSTKVPEYLATGRAVLVVGPEDQASVRALGASRRSWYAGDGTSAAKLQEALASLAAASGDAPSLSLPPELRSTFDRGPTQERLRSALSEVAIP